MALRTWPRRPPATTREVAAIAGLVSRWGITFTPGLGTHGMAAVVPELGARVLVELAVRPSASRTTREVDESRGVSRPTLVAGVDADVADPPEAS